MYHVPTQRDPLARIASVLLLAVGLGLGVYRGGVLSWLGAALGLVLLAKSLLKPSPKNFVIAGTVATLWLLCWPAIFYYVLSVWERGEVVELSIEAGDATHRVRTWILDDAGTPLVFYDAPGSVSQAWLDAEHIQVRRGSVTDIFAASVVPASRLSEDEVARVFALAEQDYGELNYATQIRYGALGRSPDRVLLIIRLQPRAEGP